MSLSFNSILTTCLMASTLIQPVYSKTFKLPLRQRDPERQTLLRRATGETSLSTAYNDANWDIDINIGGQNFTFGVDTGSSPLWVLSTRLTHQNQTVLTDDNHQFYDPLKSTTFGNVSQGTFHIAYDKGEIFLSGDVGSDNVTIAGLTANMDFGLATSVSSPPPVGSDVDGTFGMAFSAGNQIKTSNGHGASTFMDAVLPQLDEPVFTFYLPIGNNHSLEFGRVDSSLYTGDLQTVAIKNASTSDLQGRNTTSGSLGWHAYVSYSINGQNISSQLQSTIFDTGGIEARANADVVRAYWSLVKGAQDTSQGKQGTKWIFPCDSPLPDLTYNLMDPSGKPISATVPGRFFNLTGLYRTRGSGGKTNGQCQGALNSNQESYGTMGYPFWHSFFTVFNMTGPSVSIARYPQSVIDQTPEVTGTVGTLSGAPKATATGSQVYESPKTTAAAATSSSRGDAGIVGAPSGRALTILGTVLFVLGL